MSQGRAADARRQLRALVMRLIAGNTQLCGYLVQGGALCAPPRSLLRQAGWPGRAKPQNRWRRVLGTQTGRRGLLASVCCCQAAAAVHGPGCNFVYDFLK